MPLVNLSAYKAIAAAVQVVASVGNVLAISAEGGNGASNATFIDGSINNQQSTKTGKVGIGPQSPYYGNTYGAEFNGVSSYVRATSNAALNLNQGDWTIDGSFCLTKPIVGNAAIFSFGVNNGGQTPYIPLYLTPAGNIVFEEASNTAGLYNMTIPLVPNINQFYHFAIVRRNDVIYVYIDGVLKGTRAWSDPHQQSLDFTVGCLQYSTGNQWFFPGIVSNIRLVKNIALYTAGFTPSTTPPVVDGNTSMLLCSARSFKDASQVGSVVTVAGLPKIVNRSPFKPAAALAQYGGSAYFDETFIEVNTGAESIIGTDAFCMEIWAFPTDSSAARALIGNLGFDVTGISMFMQASGYVVVTTYSSGVTDSGGVLCTYNAWNHIACCRDVAGNLSIFINGVRANTVVNGFSINTTGHWRIGSLGVNDPLTKFKGRLTGARVVKGSSIYDPNQTTLVVPEAPAVDVTGTGLLYNFNSSGLVDHSLTSAIASVGSAQISTAKFKKGLSSILFNGTTDYLEVQAGSGYEFTGDFTAEFWVNFEEAAGEKDLLGNYVADTATDWVCVRNAAGKIQWYPGSSAASIESGVVPNNTWMHVALVRIGTTCTLYVDGVSVGTLQKSGTLGDATRPIRLGARGTANFLNGNIDDVQITNGVGRYTADFTPTVE